MISKLMSKVWWTGKLRCKSTTPNYFASQQPNFQPLPYLALKRWKQHEMTWKIIWIWSESFLKQQFIALVTFLPFVMLDGMPKPIGWTNARRRNENLGKCLCSIGIIVTTRLEPHSSLDQSPVSSNLVILTFWNPKFNPLFCSFTYR